MVKKQINNFDDKTTIRYSYSSLFILCFAYIMTFALGSLFVSPWIQAGLQLSAAIIPFIVARYVPFIRSLAIDKSIGFSPRPLLTTIWLLPAFIGVVFSLSLLSGWLSDITNSSTAFDYGNSVWVSILLYALVPALTEELFCRYIFLPRLSVFSPSGAIFASALFFSLMHGNFFQMPYAFVAGILLGALAVCSRSVLPCILFHFVNNLASILIHFYGNTLLPTVLLYVLLGGLAVTVLCAVFMRRHLWERLRFAFACDRLTGITVAGIFTTPVVLYLIIFVGTALIERFT